MSDNNKIGKLVIDDTVYETELSDKFLKRKAWQKADPKKITAFIPGNIREIFVKEGDRVKQGQNMLILEAMKMRNDMKAPLDGTVRKIHVISNQQVPKHTLLIELD